MKKKQIPNVWVHPDKFEWIARLKEKIGEEQFKHLSEDDKDREAEKLWREVTIDKELKQFAEMLVEYYMKQKSDNDLDSSIN